MGTGTYKGRVLVTAGSNIVVVLIIGVVFFIKTNVVNRLWGFGKITALENFLQRHLCSSWTNVVNKRDDANRYCVRYSEGCAVCDTVRDVLCTIQ